MPDRDKATTAAEGFPPRAPRQRRCRRHFPDVRKAAGAQFISLLGGTRFLLQILTAGTASVSAPERDEQDARYDRYQPPKNEQAADAELRPAGRSFVNGQSVRRIDSSLRRRFPSSLGPQHSRTKKHSSAIVAIRMRRSWGGYYRVLISERPSPLPAADTSRPYQVAVTSRLPPRDPLCQPRV